MAFLNHINSEHIFFRSAERNFKGYLRTITRQTYYVDYGEEIKGTLIVPATENGISYAVQAIINWACCNEALINRILYYVLRARGAEGYESMTRLSIAKRLEILRVNYNIDCGKKLGRRILKLADARNQYVHYDDTPVICGGEILTNEYKTLCLNNMLIYREAVIELGKIARQECGYSVNIQDSLYPLYGDGDLWLPECVAPVELKISIKQIIKRQDNFNP